jgi:hypothetical protein
MEGQGLPGQELYDLVRQDPRRSQKSAAEPRTFLTHPGPAMRLGARFAKTKKNGG